MTDGLEKSNADKQPVFYPPSPLLEKGVNFKEAAADYLQKIKRCVPVESIAVKDAGGKSPSLASLKKEAQDIRGRLKRGDFIVALVDSGSALDTKGFSKFIEDFLTGRRAGKDRLCFMVGGAWGLDKGIITEADMTLSLSRMTLPHEMAFVVLLEQVYRALTIIKREPYSH
ncbi:MAG: 23S rRNA (pseudouridine(1915)-N(3))-methyltransferase RlmH [Deltaproteobacteria bacterium]|nr:23S rRNA (pseudouridine(1915)-N(3))-methyltransferase RlmH [Deltaproteobacteria bacterium]